MTKEFDPEVTAATEDAIVSGKPVSAEATFNTSGVVWPHVMEDGKAIPLAPEKLAPIAASNDPYPGTD